MDVPWPLGLLLVLLGTPLTHAEPLYILVTPRVLRVGSPQNIHVQAHSDCGQPLTGPLEVNLMVWDFPMKRTVVATSQLMLSQENNFMVQAPVTNPDGITVMSQDLQANRGFFVSSFRPPPRAHQVPRPPGSPRAGRMEALLLSLCPS
ncbi:complement C3-like isoform X3 [Equus asinus]|uniref:complement C3-like isoform X3 n=1 Tax=Equus asinus TaxID=9793 RepID=UPI0038F63C64